MLNSIREIRRRDDEGIYTLTLEIPEKEFFLVYNDVDKQSANDLLKQYLIFRQDDARLDTVDIKHDKNNHIINVVSELNYLGNDHTDYP
ncbi:hypothetical protein [Proteiniborus sp. MB09-C3]|uniref:hypothetical protein n=1 Tax=Proteiniborus sp. MB09-C3 TaxID=3050072 RepID=UPI002553CBEA|nr:hypothetical protein [Proteiniborus sp. MB09-C3]WIV10453.1 hypothetical protein QO263_09785 [Proteiniborus sp. MB09-C3]